MYTIEIVYVYQGCFWHCIWRDQCRLSWQAFDIYRGYTFEFIKAVSDDVFDMINAVYRDKPVIFMKTVSDTEFDMMNAVYRDKPLIFIQAISLSLSRLFLTLY